MPCAWILAFRISFLRFQGRCTSALQIQNIIVTTSRQILCKSIKSFIAFTMALIPSPPMSKPSVQKRKRNRTNENFSKNIQSLMRRMEEIRRKYHADIYFCTKYKKYFEYSSSLFFRFRLEDIIGRILHFIFL